MKPRIIFGCLYSIVVGGYFLWPSAGFSQDSLKNYSLPRWKVDRLIKIAVKAKQCDTLVELQQKTIVDGARTQRKADSLINSQEKLIGTFKKDLVQRDSLNRDMTALVGIESSKKRKWRLAALGVIVLIVLKTVATGSP